MNFPTHLTCETKCPAKSSGVDCPSITAPVCLLKRICQTYLPTHENSDDVIPKKKILVFFIFSCHGFYTKAINSQNQRRGIIYVGRVRSSPKIVSPVQSSGHIGNDIQPAAVTQLTLSDLAEQLDRSVGCRKLNVM